MCYEEKPGMGIYLLPEPAEIECRDDRLSRPRRCYDEIFVMVMDCSLRLQAFEDLFLERKRCDVEEVLGAFIK